MIKHTDFVEFYIQSKITFTDVFLVLVSVIMLILILSFKNYESSDYFYWICFSLAVISAISMLLMVLIKHIELKTSRLSVYFSKKEIIISRFFKKKEIYLDEILQFQISIIKRYGVYNSSGGVRGPDVLIGIVNIELKNFKVFKLIEFEPLVINKDELHLIETIEMNCRYFIKEMGVHKSIQWNGIKYEDSN